MHRSGIDGFKLLDVEGDRESSNPKVGKEAGRFLVVESRRVIER